MPGPYDDPPYTPTSGSSYFNRRVDEPLSSGQRPWSSPQNPTGHLGAPFLGPTLASTVQTLMSEMSEIKRVSANVASMVETQREHTHNIDKILGLFERIEARIGALEDAVGDDEGNQPRKSAGGSKVSPNNHPVLKVSQCCLLPVALRSEASIRTSYTICSTNCAGLSRLRTKQSGLRTFARWNHCQLEKRSRWSMAPNYGTLCGRNRSITRSTEGLSAQSPIASGIMKRYVDSHIARHVLIVLLEAVCNEEWQGRAYR